MLTFDDALRIATEAHAGQVDKSGVDYIEHPVAVARLAVLLPSFHQLSAVDRKVCVIAAVLHDVIEDTIFDADVLKTLDAPDDVIEVVNALTHDGDSLAEYYSSIVVNPVARCVKTADLLHNNLPERKKFYPLISR